MASTPGDIFWRPPGREPRADRGGPGPSAGAPGQGRRAGGRGRCARAGAGPSLRAASLCSSAPPPSSPLGRAPRWRAGRERRAAPDGARDGGPRAPTPDPETRPRRRSRAGGAAPGARTAQGQVGVARSLCVGISGAGRGRGARGKPARPGSRELGSGSAVRTRRVRAGGATLALACPLVALGGGPRAHAPSPGAGPQRRRPGAPAGGRCRVGSARRPRTTKAGQASRRGAGRRRGTASHAPAPR